MIGRIPTTLVDIYLSLRIERYGKKLINGLLYSEAAGLLNFCGRRDRR